MAIWGIPPSAVASAREGIAAGAARLRHLAAGGFFDGMQAGCLVVAGICAVGALVVLRLLPAQPKDEGQERVRSSQPRHG